MVILLDNSTTNERRSCSTQFLFYHYCIPVAHKATERRRIESVTDMDNDDGNEVTTRGRASGQHQQLQQKPNKKNNQQQQSLNAQMKKVKQYEREFDRLSRIKDLQGLRKYAAVKIQAQFRRHKEGREALKKKKLFTRHAKRIQRYWKKYMGGGGGNGRDDGDDDN